MSSTKPARVDGFLEEIEVEAVPAPQNEEIKLLTS
jgi:hypothetical protein